jgi:hypothetical protein
MNRQSEERLEDILDRMVASDIDPNSADIADWIRQYPDYERELMGFAASWSLMKSLPSTRMPSLVDEETLVLRGMSIVQNLLHKQSDAQPVTTGTIEGLIETGRKEGISPNRLATEAFLGIALLRKLDRRLIRFATIPAEVIAALAAVLHRDTSAIASYLARPPTLAAGMRYRAEHAPELAEQEDFAVAMQMDPTMSSPDRERWLAIQRGRGS